MDSFSSFRRYCATSLVGLGIVGMLLGSAACSKKPGAAPAHKGIAGLAIHHASAKENAGVMKFLVTANPPLKTPVQIRFDTRAAVSAAVAAQSGGVDYTDVVNGALNLPANTAEAYVSVTLTNESIYEEDEVFAVRITVPDGVLVGQAEALGTILNDDAAPQMNLTLAATQPTSTVTEGPAAAVLLNLTVTGATEVTSTLKIKTADGIGSGDRAFYRTDFMLEWAGERLYPVTGGVTDDLSITIPPSASDQSGELKLLVVDDGLVEGTERAIVYLQSDTADLRIANGANIELVISDDDTDKRATLRAMNDTGVTAASGIGINSLEDVAFGADSTSTAVDGKAFNLAIYDVNGQPFTDPNTQTPGCVRDNTTGLVWEVLDKLDDSFRSNKRARYWYDPDSDTNGGSDVVTDSAGTIGYYRCDEPSATGEFMACNTAFYAADVNLMPLCGITGWRLPTTEELRSMMDYAKPNNVMAAAFPDGEAGEEYAATDWSVSSSGLRGYWTADTYAADVRQAWFLPFFETGVYSFAREQVDTKSGVGTGKQFVRLVTDKPLP